MGVKGKLVSQINIKSRADVFELFRIQNQVSDVSPEIVQGVDLLGGQWGTVGSVINWHYTLEGKKKVGKEIIEAIDEKKKSITFKVIEADLLDLYNSFRVIVDVDTNGEDNLITWTFDYEKKKENVPEPRELMDLGLDMCRQIEANYNLVPN